MEQSRTMLPLYSLCQPSHSTVAVVPLAMSTGGAREFVKVSYVQSIDWEVVHGLGVHRSIPPVMPTSSVYPVSHPLIRLSNAEVHV